MKKKQENKEHEQFIREVRMVKYIKMYSNSGFIKEPATETIINHCMWWLILFVNLTGPWDAQIFGQVLFCLCLWGCFWMRLVFKLGDKQSKVDCFPYENSSYLMVFELGHWLFSCLQTPTETSPLLRSQACRPLKWNNTMNSPRSPTCWLFFSYMSMDFWKTTAVANNYWAQTRSHALVLKLLINCSVVSASLQPQAPPQDKALLLFPLFDGETEAEQYCHDLNPGI